MRKSITYFIIIYLFSNGFINAENNIKPNISYPKYVPLIQEKETVITKDSLADFIMPIYESYGKYFFKSESKIEERYEEACITALKELGLLEKRKEIESFFRTMFLYSDDKEYQIISFRYFTIAGNLNEETIKAINEKIINPKTDISVLNAIHNRKNYIAPSKTKIIFPKEVSIKLFRYLSQRLLNKDKNVSLFTLLDLARETLPSCWDEKVGEEILATIIRFYEEESITKKGSNGFSLQLSNIIVSEDKLKKKIDVPITKALVKSLMNLSEEIDFETKTMESIGLRSMAANDAFSDKSFEIIEQAIKETKDKDIKCLLIYSSKKYKNKFIYDEAIEILKSEPVDSAIGQEILGYFEVQKDKRVIAMMIDKVKSSPFKIIEEKKKKEEFKPEIKKGIKEITIKSDGWLESVSVKRGVNEKDPIENKIMPEYPEKLLAYTIQRITKAQFDVHYTSPEEMKKIILDWWEKNKDNKEYYFEKK